MNKKIYSAAMLAFIPFVQHSAEEKPNILLIVSDDQGYADISSISPQNVQTPHLDKFAKQSKQFSQFYVEPASAPTRASLLTGRSFIRTGVWNVHFGGDYIGTDEVLLPQVLKQAGYTTGLIGKWHSGKAPGFLPSQRGFDFVFSATMHDHFDSDMCLNDIPLRLENKGPYQMHKETGWTADRMAMEAHDFMNKNKNSPFFLQLAYVAPHAPWEAPHELMDKYIAKGQSPRFAALNALIEHMDASIGKVLESLDKLNLTKNTVVIFMSDNGYVHKNVGKYNGELTQEEQQLRNPYGLRGTKGSFFEGGILSPCYVRWPDKITPGKTNHLTHVTDLLPTIAEIVGLLPKYLPKNLDGKSFYHALKNDKNISDERIVFGSSLTVPSQKKNSPLLKAGQDMELIRTGLSYEAASLYARNARFKLIKESKAGIFLYDMIADRQEKNDVSDKYPEEKEKLENALKVWFDNVLKEKNAFTKPTYLIGIEPAGVLYFNGAWKLTGDMKGNGQWAHSLSASLPESSAQWHVSVLKPGKYTVWLQAEVKGMGRKVTFGNEMSMVEATLSKASIHNLGIISIGNIDNWLFFKLIDPGVDDKPGINDLWNIVLEPLN